MANATRIPKGTLLGKATASAKVIVGKDIKVWEGAPNQGPFTIKTDIYMNKAMGWRVVHKYGVLLHEILHHLYPAKYPTGGAHQLANVIDDCRIERQGIAKREYFREALTALAIGVIANDEYNPEMAEKRWDAKTFDPSTWALLWFRSYLPEEVRDAATAAIQAYNGIADNKVDPAKFKELMDLGLAITRKRKVSTNTLLAWCNLYVETFPKASEQPNQQAGGMLSDESQGSGNKDEEGDGDQGEDQKDADKASGEQQGGGAGDESDDADGEAEGTGKGGDESDDDADGKAGGEGDEDGDEEGQGGSKGDEEGDDKGKGDNGLQDALDALRDALDAAHEVACEAAAEAAEDQVKEDTFECGDEGEGDAGDDNGSGNGIGHRAARAIAQSRGSSTIDKNFSIKMKRMVRKLRHIAIDRDQGKAKAGRVNIRRVMKADRLGVLARRPFDKKVTLEKDIPVAVAVCTDFSGSTGGLNGKLNHFAHNATYAVQEAGCECSEVSWQDGYTVIKGLDDRVSPLKHHKTQSGGGTSLLAAANGAIRSLEGAMATRKVAFIFTDGAVSDGEMRPLSDHLAANGFERAVLVSLGSSVKPNGIVDTFNATDLGSVTKIFEGWVRKQVTRAEGLA